MALIDITYFFGEFNIAGKAHQEVASNITRYIDTYEPEYLEAALGEDFAALFNAQPLDPRFNDLQAMLEKKPSPVAGCVFFHYQRDNGIIATGAGDARSKSENSERSPEVYRMTKAWNIMAKKTRKIQRYLMDNAVTFPEFDICKTDRFLVEPINSFGL